MDPSRAHSQHGAQSASAASSSSPSGASENAEKFVDSPGVGESHLDTSSTFRPSEPLDQSSTPEAAAGGSTESVNNSVTTQLRISRCVMFHSLYLKLMEQRPQRGFEDTERYLMPVEQAFFANRPGDARSQNANRFSPNYRKARIFVLDRIRALLENYDEIVSGLVFLERQRVQILYRYGSNDELFLDEFPTSLDITNLSGDIWKRYDQTFEGILDDPRAAPWLHGPLDPLWTTHFPRSAGKQTFASRLLERSVFWILYITAALGYVLIKNTVSPESTTLANCLLVYWYISTIWIICRGFAAKRFVYARKVIIGGIVGCLTGYYVLSVLMRNLTAASLTAMPAFFTVVLLIIRTH